MEWNNSINDTHFTRIMCFLLGQYFQHALCHCGRPQRIRGETFVPRAYLALLRYAYVCRWMAAVLLQPLLTHLLGWAPLLCEGLQNPTSISVGYNMLTKPIKAKTAVHRSLTSERVIHGRGCCEVFTPGI